MLILLTILATAVVGCGNGEELKLEVQQALANHTEMNTYRFSGSADLNLEDPTPDAGANPLTSGMKAMFTNGQLAWEGVASVEPVRMELALKLTPSNSNQPIEIPMLIQDNKMYLHIPAINEPEQYYEIDLVELSQLSKSENPLTSEQLGGAGQLFSSIFHDVVSAVEPKRFEDMKTDETDLKSIEITLEQKHIEEVIDIWFTALPGIINQLNVAGYIQPQTLEDWEQKLNQTNYESWIERKEDITLNQPLSLRMTIDEDGFMRESHMIVDMTVMGEDKTTKTWAVDVVNRYDDINQNPPFTQPIPKNVKPFTDILEFMLNNQNP